MKYNIIGARYNRSGRATHFAIALMKNKKTPKVGVVTRAELLEMDEDEGVNEFFVWRPKFLGKKPVKVLVSTREVRTEKNWTVLDNLEFLPHI